MIIKALPRAATDFECHFNPAATGNRKAVGRAQENQGSPPRRPVPPAGNGFATYHSFTTLFLARQPVSLITHLPAPLAGSPGNATFDGLPAPALAVVGVVAVRKDGWMFFGFPAALLRRLADAALIPLTVARPAREMTFDRRTVPLACAAWPLIRARRLRMCRAS